MFVHNHRGRFKLKNLLTVFIVVTLWLASTEELWGQWSGDPTVNTAIAVATGNQNVSCTLSDGSGGALITWTDARAGNSDAYAQLINASGAVQWTSNGVVVSAASGDQNNPVAVSDGSGGYIIAWWDTRNSSYDIYAQRINGNGVAQWTAGGVPIDTTAGNQFSPTIVADGSGGAIITWDDSRSGTSDIYAQRINSSGVVQWTTNGVPVCLATGNQTLPVLVSDGSGGAIIAWTDARGSNYDIYAQRINANGDTLWTKDGVVICAATLMQRYPVIVSDSSGGAILVWEDRRNGTDYDLYAQRLNSSGQVQWTADGVVVTAASDDQTIPVMTSDGSGGAIIAWSDFRTSSNADIYAQHLNSSGTRQWTSNGTGVVTLSSNQSSPALVSDGAGGAIITWNDARNGNTDIFAQRLDGSGNALWNSGGIAVCTATGTQDLGVANSRNTRVIVSDGAGGAIIAWNDARGGAGNDVYAQWVSSTSALPVELVSFVAHPRQSSVELNWTTATETNNYGFEVERRDVAIPQSKIGNSQWSKVGFVTATGTSNSPHEYSFVDQNLSPGRYAYRLKQVDKSGTYKYTQIWEVEVGTAPKEFTLGQNYPNPFNPSTTLEFTLEQNGRAKVKIYNMLGQEVATVFDQEAEAGRVYQAQFNAGRLTSGVYVSVLESGGKRLRQKMLLLK